MTKTENDRRELLTKIGLNPDAPALEVLPTRPVAQTAAVGVQWAPAGVNPHEMPVTEIVFDPAMVEHFSDLSPKMRSAASAYLFAQYKGRRGDKDRNSLLHRRIGEFLANEHKRRNPGGGYVREKVKLANTLAEHNVSEGDLAEFLAWKAAQQGA